MTKYYVRYEETTTWHGCIEADSLEHASQISREEGLKMKESMISTHSPFDCVTICQDSSKDCDSVLDAITNRIFCI